MADAGTPAPSTPAPHDAALEELVRRYLPVVYAAARRQLPDPSLAEDVSQAVFMVLARRRLGLPANVVMASWLLKVTHLTCLQARRDAGRRKQHERRAAQMRPTTTPADVMTDSQLAAELDATLARLGETDRSVLTLRYLEQKSVAEVAQHLGITEDAAKKRIGRAMSRLRERLGVSEEQLGATSLGAFFLSQSQITLPAHLATQVVGAAGAVGTAGMAATTAGIISKGVLKTLFWSSMKVPLLVGTAVVVLSAGALIVERTVWRGGDETGLLANSSSFENTRAASTNVPGSDYPRVGADRRATFHIYAPEARSVAIRIGPTLEMTRDAQGYWTVTTAPLPPGFYYYSLIVDGAILADPGSRTYLGSSRMMSGLEVPGDPNDLYLERDVPHGTVRSRQYYSAMSGETRQAFVYTPPGYDPNSSRRYPVLYLLPGMGEDEWAWVDRGHVGPIMDNLVAQGKAREMIVVMEEAGTSGGFVNRGPGAGGVDRQAAFPQILLYETLPMIDEAFRTIPDRQHRAIAGTSLGGAQAFNIIQSNPNKFAYVGSFSSPSGFPNVPTGFGGLLGNPEAFGALVKVMYISAGANENLTGARKYHEELSDFGIPHVFYEAPGLGHGWQTWRQSLSGMAQLLFRDP